MERNFLFCIFAVSLLAYGCSVLGPSAYYRKIGENRYSISGSDISGIGPRLYAEWERKAREACGGDFTVIDRDITGGSGHLQSLVGVIECKNVDKKVVVDSVTNNQVYEVQKKLKENGYDPGPIDGIFGKKTVNALGEFQRNNNIPITGAIDGATLEALGL